MLPWNAYSLWAEADVGPAHRPRPCTRMFVALCSAAPLGIVAAELGEQHPPAYPWGDGTSGQPGEPLLSGTQEGTFVYIFYP